MPTRAGSPSPGISVSSSSTSPDSHTMDGYVIYLRLDRERFNTNATASLSVGIRRSAFEKLAALAVQSPARDDGSELARLAQQSRSTRQADGALNGVLKDHAPTSRVPMVRYGR